MGWGVRTVSLLLCLSILLATIQRGNAERKIVCYYTNWSIYRPGTAKFSPQNINPYLCTHLIYAFGGFTKDNALKPFDKYQDIEKGGYAKFTGLKTYNKNLKTLLAIGGWNEGSSRFSPMVADPERRREFVKNAVKFLRKNHFDGLDLDWEYPAFRDGGKPRDKDNYANLVQELREEFERESSKTGRPRLLLSLAMPAGTEYIDKGYDVPRLNEYLDFINLLSYDYHSSYEPAVNHHAPLYPLEEDNEYNYDSELTIDYTVNYLAKKGASPEKIILGIPTYGRSYTLFNQDATDLGSPTDGPGAEGDATREKGYLAYYEICESLSASDDWEVMQPNPKAMGPYAFKDDQWVGYDDEDIVKLKAKYVNEKNLGGIMFWTIDNDDFRGKCHNRPYPLIEAAKEVLLIDGANRDEKTKTVDSRKKNRPPGIQSNSLGRKLGSAGRRTTTTTTTPAPRKRVAASRPKFRTFSRSKPIEEEEDDREVERRSYDPSSEEENSDRGNAVKTTEKGERSRNKNRNRVKGRPGNRNRKHGIRKEEKNEDQNEEESLSNKWTTPEPPTTPDPGTDFKCEDEGFFPHPRDCKKYFWCLDSGPSGLGVVAHQFTCPSGLVFNKAADSCDYPRNVICPKSKTTQSTPSTTRAPITAATSRTTYLYSTTRRPKPEEKPEVEEYDEEYEDEDEIEEEEEREEPKVTTTPKPLLYKTITRSKPTTTTTTTTEAPTTTSKPEKIEKIFEDEEDPKVIKELIMLIKKAGGIEQLEKQLSNQNKSPNESNSDNERVTPATISRTLYERVLNRQTSNFANKQQNSRASGFANGPGGSQFEGLDEVPEVKNLRRTQKPQYVTIERPRPTKDPMSVEEEEAELDDDEEDVASSEEQSSVSSPFLISSTQRATPNYINIRRSKPSTTTSRNENDVEEKIEDEEEEAVPIRSKRPTILLKRTESNNSSEDPKDPSEDSQQTTKSRYVNIQRFRSTTPRSSEVTESTPTTQEPTTESAAPSEEPRLAVSTSSSTTLPPTTLPATPSNILLESETTERAMSSETSSTTESVKLVEDSATEILLTTLPASPSTSGPNSRISAAAVSQPRPFGFTRRGRPTTEATTTPLPTPGDQGRSKVASSEAIRLPTLKDLIGRQNDDRTSPAPVQLDLLPFQPIHDLRKNLLSEGDAGNSSERRTLEDEGNRSLPNGKEDELNLIAGRASDYYIDENIADEFDASSKRRIDREDSSNGLRPTTMRGIPLSDLRQKQSTRWFYVTRSDVGGTQDYTGRTETEGFGTEFTTLPMGKGEPVLETSTLSTSYGTTFKEDLGTYANVEDGGLETTTQRGRRRGSSRHPGASTLPASRRRVRTTTPLVGQTEKTITEVDYSTLIPSTTLIVTESKPLVGQTEKSMTEVDYSTLTPSTLIVTESRPLNSSRTEPLAVEFFTTSIPTTVTGIFIDTNSNTQSTSSSPGALETVTESDSPRNTYSTDAESTTVQALKTSIQESKMNTTENDQDSSTASTSIATTAEKSTEPVTPITPKSRRQKVRYDSNYGFGYRGTRTRQRPRPFIEELEVGKVKRTQLPRRRVVNRRRPQAPTTDSTIVNNATVTEASPAGEFNNRGRAKNAGTALPMVEKKGKSSEENPSEQKEEKVVANAITTTEQGERLEVNSSSKGTVASPRAPASILSTRLRKPTAFSLTPAQNKTTTLTNHRKNRPTEHHRSTLNEKLDTLDEATVAPKVEKDIDQSSRAQEIAVTLTNPPSPKSAATGRPSFRNNLRRRISTTVAPRIDASIVRTTVPVPRDRQTPKPRPRPPPVVDYDYYEDEEEPVVAKSTFNGKIFLSNKGSIRCLDQGNFPHPYSCKKFITCARMVNGLVIGAEYTCPDKLSYDPIGGICNWSAGLGCKE